MPDVPKRSAGYFLAPGMDLIDLFIGSEGTLGVIAEVDLQDRAEAGGRSAARSCRCRPKQIAIALTGELRRRIAGDVAIARSARHRHRRHRAHRCAIDRGDPRRRRRSQARYRLAVRRAVRCWSSESLLIDLELPADDGTLWSQLESARDPAAADSPLLRFCRLLDRHGVLDDTEIALPADRARAAAFAELREAVPAGVNRRVALAKQDDPAISKTAADMIVPFDRFADMMSRVPPPVCRARSRSRGVGTHLRRQRPSERDPAQRRRRRERPRGDPRARRRGDRDGRMSAGRARRRPQSDQAATVAAALR